VHPVILEPYRADKDWDAVIVVCGCATACATVEASGVKKVTINSLEEVDEAIQIIWRLLEAKFD
jgi:predicted Fe-Mo cluster-binding NifX family protein